MGLNTTRTYQYDSLGNLIREEQDGCVEYKYNGFALDESTKCGTIPNSIGTSFWEYTYDGRGNLISNDKYTRTTSGMAWQNEETYVYDETNHMVDGKNELGERSLYTYNGLGLRVGRELIMKDNTHGYTDFHDETPSVETGIDKPEVVKESYVIDYTSPTFQTLVMEEEGGFDDRWVYGLDKLSVKITSEGTNWWGQNVKEDILKDYLHQDRLGSTTNLTDKFGRVVGRADYNEWGEVTYKEALSITSSYRRIYPQLNYTGHDWDDVLGMYYAKARFYDPDAKRFVEIDPVKGSVTDPLSLVSYLYCVDNPLRWVDPLGLAYDDPAPSNAKAGTYSVKGDGVRLRSEPSTSGRILATLSKYSTVTSSGRRKAGSGLYWLQVKDNASGKTGWMAEQYLVYIRNPEQHRQEMNEKRIDAATSPVPPVAPKPNPTAYKYVPGSTYLTGPDASIYTGTPIAANPDVPYPTLKLQVPLDCPIVQDIIDTLTNAGIGAINLVDHTITGISQNEQMWTERWGEAWNEGDILALGEAGINIVTLGSWNGFWDAASERERAFWDNPSLGGFLNIATFGILETFERPLNPKKYGIDPNSPERWEAFWGAIITEVGLCSAVNGIKNSTAKPDTTERLQQYARENYGLGQIEGITSTWGNLDSLPDHYSRHGADFGSITQSQYVQMAHELYVNRSQFLVKVDAGGHIRVYDPFTNSFGAYNPNGTTKTFFKPKTGIDYWNGQ